MLAPVDEVPDSGDREDDREEHRDDPDDEEHAAAQVAHVSLQQLQEFPQPSTATQAASVESMWKMPPETSRNVALSWCP